MNYQKIYEDLIRRGVERGWTKRGAPCYVERHHIIPRAMGGTDSKSNLVILTAKEHFVAHHLLYKIHRNRETFYGLWAMMHDNRNNRIRFPDIPKMREDSRKYALKGSEHPLFGVGHTKESRKKMSESHTGKILTNETRERMSKARLNNTCQSKGVYHTPAGVGRSLRELGQINGCSTTTIQNRCKRFCDATILSRKLPEEWQGRTFREVGWYFVPDVSEGRV